MATITYWKDIDINLNKKNDGDVLDMINEDAIVNSLTNIFETLQGTRRMLPDFAVSIHNMLFEQLSESIASTLGTLLLYAVSYWETRIVVDNINIVVDEDNNRYEVDLTYHLSSSSAQQSQVFSSIIQAR